MGRTPGTGGLVQLDPSLMGGPAPLGSPVRGVWCNWAPCYLEGALPMPGSPGLWGRVLASAQAAGSPAAGTG